ncbi:restriction endonuclease [Corallococcus sp. H22C18031201]|nr:restriction endonuclease [Corallococcus sp. H22C18031201]
MSPPVEAALLDALDRQARRRAEGVATLSVLAGPLGSGAALWSRWAERQGRRVVVTDAEEPRSAALDWARALSAERDLGADAEALATFALTAAHPRHAPSFAGKTPHERRVLLDALPPPALPEFTWALCRQLIEQRPSFDPGTLPPPVREALRREPHAALKALEALVPARHLPALRCRAGASPTLWGLQSAAALCLAAPMLPLACTVEPDALDAFLRGRESQVLAVAREGRLDLGAPVPTPVAAAADAAMALHGRLAREQAPDAKRVLHAEAARAVLSGAPGTPEEFARSKAEQFLAECLRGRPATAGLFQLNQRLQLAGEERAWEVDLLCREWRLAVEIDGYFHFLDAERFRRDRRKDLALQRAGYWVVRVLAEDVVSRAEDILDTLESLIAARQRDAVGQEAAHGRR